MRNLRKMTKEQVQKDWGGLQKRHRMEIAERVADYCIGNKMEEVAEWLGYSGKWVQTQLDCAGISAAIGTGGQVVHRITGSSDNVARNEIPRMLSEFAPSVTVKTEGGANGGANIVAVEGKDAEEFEPYLEHYTTQGHELAAALRLAKAEWAAEAAVEAGVIKEDQTKENERVNRILFPDRDKDSFDIDLRTHLNRVKCAAAFLDAAKVNFLRRKSTCEMVESANEAWVEQVERVLNFHVNHQ